MSSPADDEVDEFAAACNRLYSIMHRNRSSLTATGGDALSESQLALVAPLAEHGPMPVGRLAAIARISQPTATRALKQLDDRGVVARERAREDRTVLVSLTPRGVRMCNAAVDRIRVLQRAALEQIPPERRPAIVAALAELASAIDRTS